MRSHSEHVVNSVSESEESRDMRTEEDDLTWQAVIRE